MNPIDLARSRWRPVRKALEEREKLERELTQAGERLAALQNERLEVVVVEGMGKRRPCNHRWAIRLLEAH